jgi:glutathione S-transferase
MTMPTAKPITMYDLAAADPAIRFSPFCWRTRFSLLHKGLAFDAVPWRFTQRDALAPSGQARVPVIVDHDMGERWVNDSWAIALYLDATYPERPLLMPTPADKANGRFVAAWAETAVHLAAFPLILNHMHTKLDPVDQPYFRDSREARFGRKLEDLRIKPKAGIEALHKVLAPAEQALLVSPYLSGTKPGYADYALAGSLMWIWVTCPVPPFDASTAVGRWFLGMLELFDGHGRKVPLMR